MSLISQAISVMSPLPPPYTWVRLPCDFFCSFFFISPNFCWKLDILDNTAAILGTDPLYSTPQGLLLLFAYLLSEWLDDFSEVNPTSCSIVKSLILLLREYSLVECPQLWWDGSSFGKVLFVKCSHPAGCSTFSTMTWDLNCSRVIQLNLGSFERTVLEVSVWDLFWPQEGSPLLFLSLGLSVNLPGLQFSWDL